jgi:hypothetical protein
LVSLIDPRKGNYITSGETLFLYSFILFTREDSVLLNQTIEKITTAEETYRKLGM